MIITEEYWEENFKPVLDHPCEFDEVPKEYIPDRLWTQCDAEDDVIVICAGNHLVNRQGYWYTEIPHTYDEVVEIQMERDESVTILWGEAPQPDQKPVTYYFDTEEEVIAFMRGIEEMNGWNGYEVIENE